VIEVDESGTRVGGFMDIPIANCLPEQVSFNRPFAYLIRDGITGTILLMGTYLNPTGHGTSG
jgi:serine protease inhibitor